MIRGLTLRVSHPSVWELPLPDHRLVVGLMLLEILKGVIIKITIFFNSEVATAFSAIESPVCVAV